MLDAVLDTLARTVEANPWVAPAAAFAGGLTTAANPCVLAMVPLMVAYVAGQEARTVRRSLLLSLTFSLGLTIMFLLLGLAAWAASSVLRANWWTYVASAVCLLMGLQLLGILTLEFPRLVGTNPQRRGMLGALLLGLLFGLVSLPCAGPVLVVVLSLVPLKGAAFGGLLLAAYSLGHCGLILVGGTSMGLVQRLADSKGWSRLTEASRRLAGGVILLIGVWLLVS